MFQIKMCLGKNIQKNRTNITYMALLEDQSFFKKKKNIFSIKQKSNRNFRKNWYLYIGFTP